MAARSTVVTVTTTAAKVVTGADTDSNKGFRDASIQNTGSITVYLGGSDVTSSNGWPLAAGANLDINEASPDDLPWAVTASGTSTLAILELGV